MSQIIIPAAIIKPLTLRMNLPKLQYYANFSQLIKLASFITTIPDSFLFIYYAFFPFIFPSLRSITDTMSSISHSLLALWQCRTDTMFLSMFLILPNTVMRPVRTLIPMGGQCLGSPTISPLLISVGSRFLILNPLESPGSASFAQLCPISTEFTSELSPLGENRMHMPRLRIPHSTLPTGTVPIPPILQTSSIVTLNGFKLLFSCSILSKAPIRVAPLYHKLLGDLENRLSPFLPEIGMKSILISFNYIQLSIVFILVFIQLYLWQEKAIYFQSILLMQTIIYLTPKYLAKMS